METSKSLTYRTESWTVSFLIFLWRIMEREMANILLKKRNTAKVFALINSMTNYKTIIIKTVFDQLVGKIEHIAQKQMYAYWNLIYERDGHVKYYRNHGLFNKYWTNSYTYGKKWYRILATNHIQINLRLIKDPISKLIEYNTGGFINYPRIG